MVIIADKALRAPCFGRGWAVLPLRRVSPRAPPPGWGPWGPRIRRARALGAAEARARECPREWLRTRP
eukprot:8680650-Pyramimonas_sp.AAC.1